VAESRRQETQGALRYVPLRLITIASHRQG